MAHKRDHELVLVLDFGGQYSKLIARRIREGNVYSEVVPYDISLEKIKSLDPIGIVFSGGPASVYSKDTPDVDSEIFALGIPILGICYGMQLMCHTLAGGKVEAADEREYGRAILKVRQELGLLAGMRENLECWMSHGDRVTELPDGFEIIGETSNSPVAAIGDQKRGFYGVQFHPEVVHTSRGTEIINNFLSNVCNASGDWTTSNFIEETVEEIKAKVGSKQVICGLSGGVDSSVAAALVHKAIGDQLTCIFVDHGLLRKNEAQEVKETFGKEFDMNLIAIDAQERFLSQLEGVADPEQKRKVIGTEFIRVFEEEAKKVGNAQYLVQGTIYSDVIESGGSESASTIKSHHNVGGLPEDMEFKLVEPLRELFKDEVREVGEELGLPEEIVWRQPFPGPGLGIRVLREITPEKVRILKEADAIFREEIKQAGLSRDIWQYFAVLPPMRSVGVMGDERTYSYTIGLRAVKSKDAMTADWAKIPHDLLEKISRQITNRVPEVNRIVYDITSKPPATIEWE
ncbi:GMP synthase (glutamine-hydrolyzing) [Halobacteroides halobius DSM 5150]|uniref:GMP synthase [glutamine-hydrolyzing] n=1 Tax=Halobacteroides halobius (strain ATCC 35273 / DSM 5150 / MD-1) TaxID=748449 RepID=L0K7K8_HALHC|nr:glutamine-hydrolyzing GMP synthase [Halobacteroides halobius]AGB40319.1 GMP synthase (glutamine-hydrolyzing) [Halobacteroides halobius DSM 5150]